MTRVPRVHRLTLYVSCTDTNHQGHCALAPLQPCTGLTPLLTYTNIPLLSLHRIPASIRDSRTLGTFKTALKTHLFNSAYTSCHWQPSIGASDSLLRDFWRQPKKYLWLIDWLIDKSETEAEWRKHYIANTDDVVGLGRWHSVAWRY